MNDEEFEKIVNTAHAVESQAKFVRHMIENKVKPRILYAEVGKLNEYINMLTNKTFEVLFKDLQRSSK